MILVNLFAGPGSGKSTTAAGAFYRLKSLGVNCELITEYAKDKVWDKHFAIFDNQLYITAKQHHRQHRLDGQVSVAITDSPLLLSVHYNQVNDCRTKEDGIREHFEGLVHGLFNSFDNMNFFIERKKAYNPIGRMQNEDEAKEIDSQVLDLLHRHNVSFSNIPGDGSAVDCICRDVFARLNGIS